MQYVYYILYSILEPRGDTQLIRIRGSVQEKFRQPKNISLASPCVYVLSASDRRFGFLPFTRIVFNVAKVVFIKRSFLSL